MSWKGRTIQVLEAYEAWQQALRTIPPALEALPRQSREARELAGNLEQARRMTHRLGDAMTVLTPEERLILHRMYICPQKGRVESLCQALNREKSTIYRRRDKALEKLALALYGGIDGKTGEKGSLFVDSDEKS